MVVNQTKIYGPVENIKLVSKKDVQKYLLAILKPVETNLIQQGTRFSAGTHGVCYSENVAELEGWSRLLWGVAPLIAGGGQWSIQDFHANGFRYGTDKDGVFYWGDVHDFDQRIVEMAAMALALLIAPKVYWEPLTEQQKKNTAQWLLSVNQHKMPKNNWYFFRVLVNLALEIRGCPYDAALREQDLEFLESLYMQDGWYKDSVPYDNYNPFAFHFYSLIYCAFKSDTDTERCDRFKERARLFSQQFIFFFTQEGDFIPFGRSLTYRFAVVSFYAACAFAKLELLPWGQMKGIILRNFRWWAKRPIFDNAGLLTVGFGYGSLYHSEQYNSPGSPYWALKAFLILALSDDHPFWKSDEEPLPMLEQRYTAQVPHMLFQRTADDVLFLNGGQYPAFELNNAAAKYAKFAYSARLGFSVSISNWGLDKIGCDNMLFLRESNDLYWRERRQGDVLICCNDFVCSRWQPWGDVSIITWLIPYLEGHIRVHQIDTSRSLIFAEGGFSLPISEGGDLLIQIEESDKAYAKKGSMVSSICSLTGPTQGVCIESVPNVNILHPRTVVPVLQGTFPVGKSIAACAVYAGKDKKMVEATSLVSIELNPLRCILGDGTVIELKIKENKSEIL